MPEEKTPGVFISENNAFPSSAVAVETAVPVFIGYTEKAERNGKSLTAIPTRISSLAEYVAVFGGAFKPAFHITEDPKGDMVLNGKTYIVDWSPNHNLYFYSCIRFFYLNGGGNCYILSVGNYTDAVKGISSKRFTGDPTASPALPNVFEILEKEYEPTLVLMPDVVSLEDNGYALYTEVLKHCNKTQSRFGIFDVGRSTDGTNESNVKLFRESIGSEFLKYGAAYYPWLQTSVIDASEVNFTNLDDYTKAGLVKLIPKTEDQARQVIYKGPGLVRPLTQPEYDAIPADLAAYNAQKEKAVNGEHIQEELDEFPDKKADLATYNAQPGIKKIDQTQWDAMPVKPANLAAWNDQFIKPITQADFDKLPKKGATLAEHNASLKLKNDQNITNYHQSLVACSPTYKKLMVELRNKMNLLPPSSAMAGIYTLVDTSRGVWKAPANVSVAAAIAPEVNISNDEQQTMNIDPVTGKSINIIRTYPGIGTLVWGARTLDGNSQDWRYINVRRTLIMIEQSLKLATRTYVFEPNDSGTWVTIQSMINNFLYNLWKQGALAGAVPEEAYSVQIGLGATMTPNDILDGLLRVTVRLAIVRPAEFIELTFQQQQQQA